MSRVSTIKMPARQFRELGEDPPIKLPTFGEA